MRSVGRGDGLFVSDRELECFRYLSADGVVLICRDGNRCKDANDSDGDERRRRTARNSEPRNEHGKDPGEEIPTRTLRFRPRTEGPYCEHALGEPGIVANQFVE